MKTLKAMQASQIRKFARFLEEHPGFSPELMGENACVYGFHVGGCLLSVEEMEKLIDTQVHFDARQEAVLRIPPPAITRRRLP